MKFEVGITVFRQYDILEKCLDAIETSTMLPERVIVVDNGREYKNRRKRTTEFELLVVTPDLNKGVAASWNLLLKLIHPKTAIILNDDCIVSPETFRLLMNPEPPALVKGIDFSCFRQDQRITEIVGQYDERYWPAYYEDSDFVRRMQLAGISPVELPLVIKSHGNHGERPYQNMTTGEYAGFLACVEQNKQLYISKWGGLPSDHGI